MKLNKNVGLLVLGVYLILLGLIGLFGLHFSQLNLIVPLLALVAGIFILMGR